MALFAEPDIIAPDIIAVMAAVLIGGFVKGTIGFGMPVVAMSIMAAFLPVTDAVALMVFPIIAANLLQAWQGGYFAAVLKRFWPLGLAMALGILLGAFALKGTDPQLLLLVLAVTVLLGVGLDLSPWRPTISGAAERPLGLVAALASGVIGGITSSFGLLFTVYLNALRLPRDFFVASIGVLWTIGSFVLLGAFTGLGLLRLQQVPLSLLLAVAALAGMELGRRMRHRIDEILFRRLILIALTLLALNLVRRSLL